MQVVKESDLKPIESSVVEESRGQEPKGLPSEKPPESGMPTAAPSANQSTPSANQSAPSANQSASSANQSASSANQSASSANQSAPSTNQSTPSANQSAPSASNPIANLQTRYIPSLATLAAKQFILDKKNAAAWQEFYNEHKYESWKDIYEALCSEEGLEVVIPEASALKIWHALSEKYREKRSKPTPSLVTLSIHKILSGPHGAKFWDLICQFPNYEVEGQLKAGIAKLLGELHLPAEQESLINDFCKVLKEWYECIKRTNDELKRFELPQLETSWILARGFKWNSSKGYNAHVQHFLQLYMDEYNWSACHDEQYFSAIRLAVKCNNIAWIHEQRIQAFGRWQRLMKSSEWNKQIECIFTEPVLSRKNATAWITFWNLLPEPVQKQILLTHGATMLAEAIQAGQIEHLRYFWDKLPDGVARPNFSKALKNLIANYYDADDVLEFLYNYLSADDFFTWSVPEGGENRRLYRLVESPKLFVFFWERAGKERQLRWLAATNNYLFNFASRKGQIQVVRAIWQALPEKHAELLQGPRYSAFCRIENPCNDDELLATKKFIYESNAELQDALLVADDYYSDTTNRGGYQLFRDTAGSYRIKTATWLWDNASATHRRRMIERNPTTLLWLLKSYANQTQQGNRREYESCVNLADKILGDLCIQNPDLYQDLIKTVRTPVKQVTVNKIKISEENGYYLDDFWTTLCCEYFFSNRDHIPAHVQEFIAQAFTLKKLYECLTATHRRDYFQHCFERLLGYNNKQADQFAALLAAHFGDYQLSKNSTSAFQARFKEWRTTHNYSDSTTLAKFKRELGISEDEKKVGKQETALSPPPVMAQLPASTLHVPAALPVSASTVSSGSSQPAQVSARMHHFRPDSSGFSLLGSLPKSTSSSQRNKISSCKNLYYFTAACALLSASVAAASMVEILKPALLISAFHPPLALLITAAVIASIIALALTIVTINLIQKSKQPSSGSYVALRQSEQQEDSALTAVTPVVVSPISVIQI